MLWLQQNLSNKNKKTRKKVPTVKRGNIGLRWQKLLEGIYKLMRLRLWLLSRVTNCRGLITCFSSLFMNLIWVIANRGASVTVINTDFLGECDWLYLYLDVLQQFEGVSLGCRFQCFYWLQLHYQEKGSSTGRQQRPSCRSVFSSKLLDWVSCIVVIFYIYVLGMTVSGSIHVRCWRIWLSDGASMVGRNGYE